MRDQLKQRVQPVYENLNTSQNVELVEITKKLDDLSLKVGDINSNNKTLTQDIKKVISRARSVSPLVTENDGAASPKSTIDHASLYQKMAPGPKGLGLRMQKAKQVS